MNDKNTLYEELGKTLHKNITECFLNSCNMLIEEDLDDETFKFCIDIIKSTIQ
jgi:hypothetical protein